jgi:hypothetical protein
MILREQHLGKDHRYLRVQLEPGRGLIVEGQDIGPSCPDGDEYEWTYRIAEDRIPELLELLGARPDEPVMAVLSRFNDDDAARFETIAFPLRSDFFCWP